VPRRVKNRAVVLVTAAGLVGVAAVLAGVCACSGGSSGGGSGNSTEPQSGVVLTVEQALVAKEGEDLNVRGGVLATGDRTVMVSAFAESYPPQAGGAILPLAGLDLTALVGLTSSAGKAGATEATWSDYSLVLNGVITGGTLTVKGTPRVEEDTSIAGLRLRFSPVSEPISSGDQVWWAFDVTNTGQSAVQLTFFSGQRGELILTQGGGDEYTWSDGKSFAQVIENVTLEPGGYLPVVLNDTLSVPPGDYDVTARVTAMVGPSDSEAPLPDLRTTLIVH
jgi:hypothetical protein